MPLITGKQERWPAALLLVSVLVGGCTRRETRTETAATNNANAMTRADTGSAAYDSWNASVPAGGSFDYDPEFVEQGRLDDSWMEAARLDREARQSAAPRRSDGPMIHPRSPEGEALSTERRRMLTGGSGRTGGVDLSLQGHERVWTGEASDSLAVATIQIWLDYVNFSPGVIDGKWGKNTAKALYWFQEAYGIAPTGRIDSASLQMLERLAGDWDPVVRYSVTGEDVKGPFTPLPEDVYEKAKLSCLCYSSPAEALGEKFHTTAEFLQSLNKGVDLGKVAAGTELIVPHVDSQPRLAAAADSVVRIVVSKRGFYTHAVDASGNIVFHFPSTVGSKYDPSPEGNLRITGIAFDPPFHYQPKLFHDVSDDKPEAHLPAGPNSPVGVVWMQLSKENYGIHGTATPETIGYESSHGCIRLANWNALLLARHVKPGVRVEFTDKMQAAAPATGGGAGGR
jgi:lipoprotein-anchoring transpeptidase ErfK/SrfK